VAVKLHADGLARSRFFAFGVDRQRRGGWLVAALHMRGELQRGIQRSVEFHRVDDPRQRVDTLGPRRKIQSPGGPIAAHLHVVHRRHGIDGQGVPDLQALQQVPRGCVQRVGAHIRARGVGCGRGAQRHPQTLLAQRQRQARRHRAATSNGDIHPVHPPL
jgi:hypothetical protein